MIKDGLSPELGWKEEEDLARARQKIETDFATRNAKLDLQMEDAIEKIDQMVVQTLKVKDLELSEQITKLRDLESEKRRENSEYLISLKEDLKKLDLSDIEDWAFFRLCALDNEEGSNS